MPMAECAQRSLAGLSVGTAASFEADVSAELVDAFARLSGDTNPLHVDEGFARERGFTGRLAHGALLGALVSRLIGMHLPGRDALLQSLSLSFRAPVPAGTHVRVTGEVDQVSESARAAVLRVTVTDTADGRVMASGKAQVGFTREAGGS